MLYENYIHVPRRTGFLIQLRLHGFVMFGGAFGCLQGRTYGNVSCGVLWDKSYLGYLIVYLGVAIFAVPCIIMMTAYFRIGVTLWRSIAVRKQLKSTGFVEYTLEL